MKTIIQKLKLMIRFCMHDLYLLKVTYISMIVAGKIDINQVPKCLRNDIISDLNSIGLDENGYPL